MKRKIFIGILIAVIVVVVFMALFYYPKPKTLPAPGTTEMMKVEKIIYPKVYKGILLELNINNDELTFIESEIVNGYPNYLLGSYDFVARIFSSDDELLGEYGFGDPKIIVCEEGCIRPTPQDNVNFTLILPYFLEGKIINIYSANKLLLSIDVTNPQVECLGSCMCMEKCNEEGPTYFIPSEEGASKCSVNSINKICCCSGV